VSSRENGQLWRSNRLDVPCIEAQRAAMNDPLASRLGQTLRTMYARHAHVPGRRKSDNTFELGSCWGRNVRNRSEWMPS
jgi:hypothetical protein